MKSPILSVEQDEQENIKHFIWCITETQQLPDNTITLLVCSVSAPACRPSPLYSQNESTCGPEQTGHVTEQKFSLRTDHQRRLIWCSESVWSFQKLFIFCRTSRVLCSRTGLVLFRVACVDGCGRTSSCFLLRWRPQAGSGPEPSSSAGSAEGVQQDIRSGAQNTSIQTICVFPIRSENLSPGEHRGRAALPPDLLPA